MKTKILTWGLMLMTAFSTSFANNTANVNKDVINAFQKDFSTAREVKWENKKEFDIATFSLNGRILFAYYAQTGELIAVSRNMLSNELPIMLQKDIKKKYHDYWITNLFEIDTDSETAYYITLENSDYTMVMKSTGAFGWELYSRKLKN